MSYDSKERLNEIGFYKKGQSLYYMKQNYYVVDSLMSQKEKLKKYYRYDLLSY